jgi:hypothetical protein
MVLGWTARQVVVIDDDLGRSGGYDGTGGLQSAPEALWWSSGMGCLTHQDTYLAAQ